MKYLEGFENNFAKKLGAKQCIGVNTGTIAIALKATGIKNGDEVISVCKNRVFELSKAKTSKTRCYI